MGGVKSLSIVVPFYVNPGMLALQYEGWAGWPQELKDRTEVVIVDDGSPMPAADVPRPEGLPALSIYRVLEDRPWHQHGARNLGAHVAAGRWLLLTDMDHMLEAEQAGRLFSLLDTLDAGSIYMLRRIEADTRLPTIRNGQEKPHPNSFVVTRETYWRIGGYDEDYCGHYGTDRLFRGRAFSIARPGFLAGVALTRYWRDLVPDASTTTLQRKDGRDPGAKARIAREKAARGESDVVKTLQFPWQQVL